MSTPERGEERPIFVRDIVAVDFTFLEEVLEPGDPLIFDYVSMAACPRRLLCE